MTRRGRITLIVLLGSALVVAAALLLVCWAQAQKDDPLLEMLDQTHLTYRKIDNNSYIVPFTTDAGGSLDVYLTYNDSNKLFALIFTTVVDKDDNFSFGRDVLEYAMKLNNDYPGMKFCLDAQRGDLDCQTEMLMSTATSEELKMYLNLVARMADDSASELKRLVH